LFPNGLRIWHFSGDADGCVPTLGTQYWINKLNMAIKTEWKAWHARNQVAGFVQEYDNNFVFLTVKGAGHIATYDRREEMYIAWNAFLNGTLPS
jgi:serine carboxypeptidase-like clade 2